MLGTPSIPPVQSSTPLSHMDLLEASAIFIMREVVAEVERPGLLFSGGKDSAVLLHLAAKAFAPAAIPFPVVHIDTGHNFPEVLAFRDSFVAHHNVSLVVGDVDSWIRDGRIPDPGYGVSRNRLQSPVLLDVIERHRFDACFGGARRDEDKARAKERVISLRNAFGEWDPRNQRPELWQLYHGRHAAGEHLRAFPLSDWTEMDVWEYIVREEVPLPELYFAHERSVVERDGILLSVSDWITPTADEEARREMVRFRTVGDATCTGAVRSTAATARAIIHETALATVSERGATRADDRTSSSSMEDRKREGYF